MAMPGQAFPAAPPPGGSALAQWSKSGQDNYREKRISKARAFRLLASHAKILAKYEMFFRFFIDWCIREHPEIDRVSAWA